MSNNPVISRNPYFNGQTATPNTYPYGTQVNGQGVPQGDASQAYAPYNAAAQQQGMPQYGYQSDGPFASAQTTTMTYDDAMVKTFALLALAVLSGVGTATLLPLSSMMPVAIGTTIAAFIIGMIGATQRLVKPIFAVLYSVLEGICLGALTGALDALYPGIAVQAVLGTVLVVGVAAALHFSGAVRTTTKGFRIMMTVMIAGIIYGLVNLVVIWTGASQRMWGFSSMRVGGIPLGVIIGLVLIVAASYMLISDLEQVKFAVANGAPKAFAWTCAFAIVMTVLWIYIEVLRILAIVASDR
ncbi:MULTISPECIES: Bax inhibitor-1/YccA family protein [unclassified Actinobaculum]|uniref:Bax inhibitor-1/YccA family protein n=1 Tax=unclassified Actinobaculum TaxID=2609299 RepID=UPI000D527168|nr:MULTISPECIES: Bax inhibitor-1/YccA family protein [unclassified Actinobaculum]AWE41844.1 hypothetical protein DDD63_02685 [Actinobaculum sp. 313]RTE50238.1 Bax inhibitor-1/YccA family protein [Actinobaculum sp. 352]